VKLPVAPVLATLSAEVPRGPGLRTDKKATEVRWAEREA